MCVVKGCRQTDKGGVLVTGCFAALTNPKRCGDVVADFAYQAIVVAMSVYLVAIILMKAWHFLVTNWSKLLAVEAVSDSQVVLLTVGLIIVTALRHHRSVGRFLQLPEKVDRLVTETHNLGTRLQNLESKVDGLETATHNLGTRLQNLDSRVDRLATEMHNLGTKVDGLMTGPQGVSLKPSKPAEEGSLRRTALELLGFACSRGWAAVSTHIVLGLMDMGLSMTAINAAVQGGLQPVRSGYVDVVDKGGARLYWEEYGAPNARPLFLLNGGCSKVLIHESRGIGRSSCNAVGRQTTTLLAADAHAVLDGAWGTDSAFALFGVSLGGLVAQELLYRLVAAGQKRDMLALHGPSDFPAVACQLTALLGHYLQPHRAAAIRAAGLRISVGVSTADPFFPEAAQRQLATALGAAVVQVVGAGHMDGAMLDGAYSAFDGGLGWLLDTASKQ
eukprot:XP_001695713.1 predicted protein [Chlamydomonas reinhardtii]